MNATLVTLAISFALAQHPGAPAAAADAGAPPPAGAVEAQAAAPAPHEAAQGEAAHGEGGEAADESLGAVMMHHVEDGYRIEHPGYCGGQLRWDCDLDLKEVFGNALVFHVGKVTVDMTPTKHVIMLWLASALLLVVVFAALRKKSLVPNGLYNFVEMLVQFVRNEITVKNIGEKDADRFAPYLVSVFFFILFANLFGLIPFAATATGNLSVTMMLAAFTFVITQWAAIRAMGIGGFLKHLTGGVAPWLWPIMVPVEILGLFTKPFALTVRLFANMVAGHFVILALLGLIFALHSPWVAFGSVPMALGIFLLELFVGFVQAYIFTMLSALFIGAGLAHHGDEHEAHGEHGGSEHHASHVAGASPGHG